MEKIKIPRGFTPKLDGSPDLTMIQIPFPRTIGCSAKGIPFIRPKLLVKEGDWVQTGSPVFTDKRDLSTNYLSPATGRVEKILYGERRRLEEVIILAEKKDEFFQFDPIGTKTLADLPKSEIADRLKQGGLWQGLRQFPAMDTADPDHTPAMIIVSLNGNDLFSPHPGRVLENNVSAFETGIAALKRFSHNIVITARQSCLAGPDRLDPSIESQITHQVADTYPAWNPGAVLFALKENEAQNLSWCISLDHLIMMGKFILTGQYPIEKIVTLTRGKDRRPHLKTRQGVPLDALTGKVTSDNIMTTGRFNGRLLSPQSHLGFFENTVNIIEAAEQEEMFGFLRPGRNKATLSSSFLSSVFKTPVTMDATLHGEVRACINCSYCERICPNNLMPSFIMKALEADEIEEALGMGLLDCCQCGLCSFACPSKIELAKILANGMDAHYKDKA